MRLEQPVSANLVAAAVSNMLEDAGDFSPSDRGMMAWAEGILTAAAIGPERTRPDEWAKAVFGPDCTYEDAEQAQASVAMLALLYNKIVDDLRHMRADYAPLFLEHARDGEEIRLAAEWAQGFIRGMHLREHVWDALVASKQGKLSLAAIIVFLPGVLKSDWARRNSPRRRRMRWRGSDPQCSRFRNTGRRTPDGRNRRSSTPSARSAATNPARAAAARSTRSAACLPMRIWPEHSHTPR